MDMLSLPFYLRVATLVPIYYVFPKKCRPYILLAGSLEFYRLMAGSGRKLFLASVAFGYGAGILLEWLRKRGLPKDSVLDRAIWWSVILAAAFPLIGAKHGDFISASLLGKGRYPWIIPLGLSFYTMQMIAYLADIHRGRISAEKNPFRYGLFMTFFPQIVQGPIPRYQKLASQLWEGHAFQEKLFAKGCMLVLWGFFLKMMIADKAAIVVNTVFEDSARYPGLFVLTAGCLYSIQLYADFHSCTSIAQGIAQIFGIYLEDNFRHPYLAVSVKDFWRRWHISLSSWLRDYVYIPLGGSRNGTWKKYGNLLLTFAVSGLWHGPGYKYLFWGLLHGSYQIAGELSAPFRERLCQLLNLPEEDFIRRNMRRAATFFLVMIGWIIFRAESLRKGLAMVWSMVLVWNPWIFFDDSLLRLGLAWKEWIVLALSIYFLAKVSLAQEKVCIRDWILEQRLVFRWAIYIGAVVAVLIYGTYGFGFNAQDFIYGGF